MTERERICSYEQMRSNSNLLGLFKLRYAGHRSPPECNIIPHPISFMICFSLIPSKILPRCAMMRALDSSGSLPYAEVTKSYPNSASGVVYFATPQP